MASYADKFSEHFSESRLPIYSVIAAITWHLIYLVLGDKLLLSFIPEKGREKIEGKKATDAEKKLIFKVNGVAFLHAAVSSFVAVLLMGACLSAEWPVSCSGSIYLVHGVLGCMMLGYFLWDLGLCVVYFKTFQMPFLLHALFSYVGLYVNMAAQRTRLECWSTFFQISEISTPFMHIRYALIQGGLTHTWYFKLMNWLFIILFTSYRLVIVELFGFLPFLRELWAGRLPMSGLRVFCILFTICGWVVLNYGWGLALLRSQLRHLFGRPAEKRD